MSQRIQMTDIRLNDFREKLAARRPLTCKEASTIIEYQYGKIRAIPFNTNAAKEIRDNNIEIGRLDLLGDGFKCVDFDLTYHTGD